MKQAQQDRYARQIRLAQIGEKGQQAILDASVLIVGQKIWSGLTLYL